MPKAETVTNVPGIVSVRAVENREGLLREGSACGFFVVSRKPGDIFELNKWEEFSPRWMEWVDEATIPDGWLDKIEAREAERLDRIRLADIEAKKSPAQLQQELIEAAARQAVVTMAGAQALHTKGIPSHEFNHSSGQFKRGPGRPPREIA